MANLRSIALLALLAASTTAVPAPAADANLETRQVKAATCGNHGFTSSQVSDAFNEGCRLASGNRNVGDGGFPHDFDGGGGTFDFGGGDHKEFPIVSGGVFNGGSPGDHRVVFDRGTNGGGCSFLGTVTHSGQRNNAFTSCRN